MLRSNNLIWRYYIHNYLRGEAPPKSDFLYWNSDSTRLPAEMCSYYLREFYLKTTWSKRTNWSWEIARSALGAFEQPLYLVGTEQDHICPWKETFKILQPGEGSEKVCPLRRRTHHRDCQSAIGAVQEEILDQRRKGAGAQPGRMALRCSRNNRVPGGTTGRRGWRKTGDRRVDLPEWVMKNTLRWRKPREVMYWNNSDRLETGSKGRYTIFLEQTGDSLGHVGDLRIQLPYHRRQRGHRP